LYHVIFAVSLFFSNPSINKKYPLYFFSFLLLFIFLALRYDFGNDYMAYLFMHEKINQGITAWGSNDILYFYLNRSVPNFFVFIVFTSLIYISVIFTLIKNNLKFNYYWLSILILLIDPRLLLVHSSAMRQTLAILIFIIAIKFTFKRSFFMYSALIILATGFHSSAIILLPFYFFLTDKKINIRILMIFIVVFALFLYSPLYEPLMYQILEFFPINYINYFENYGNNSLRSTLIQSFYTLFTLFNINKLNNKEIIFGKLYLLGTLISIIAIKLSMIVRIVMYFNIFSIIAIPLMFSKINSKKYKVLLFSLMLLIYLLRYYSFFTDPMWSSFLEYRTIITK